MNFKENKNRIIGIIILFTLVLIAGFLYKQNHDLQDRLAYLEAEASEERAELEAQIAKLDKAEITTQKGPSLADLFGTVEEVQAETKQTPTSLAPKLSVTPELNDLGTISKANGPATARFVLTNEGSRNLEISYAFTSCGCTAAPIEDDVLEPGQSTNMDVSYDPNYYGQHADLGQIVKSVTIISNDRDNPFYKVQLQANVVP